MPPTRVEITGSAFAIASRIETGRLSPRVGRTKTSSSRIFVRNSGSNPWKRASSPSRAASAVSSPARRAVAVDLELQAAPRPSRPRRAGSRSPCGTRGSRRCRRRRARERDAARSCCGSTPYGITCMRRRGKPYCARNAASACDGTMTVPRYVSSASIRTIPCSSQAIRARETPGGTGSSSRPTRTHSSSGTPCSVCTEAAPRSRACGRASSPARRSCVWTTSAPASAGQACAAPRASSL